MSFKCVLVLCMLVYVCECGRVLVAFPVPGRSHTTLGDALVRTLLNGGHDVTYIMTSSTLQSERLKVINVTPKGTLYHPDGKLLSSSELLQYSLPSQHDLMINTQYAVRALKNKEVQLLMKNKHVTFDLVIVEWFYSRLLAPLASVFECPLIWYSPVDAFWMNLQLIHEAPSSAYAGDLQASNMPSEIPSVKERAFRILKQIYTTAWQMHLEYFVEVPLYKEYYQAAFHRRERLLPYFEDVAHSGAMLLINSHPILGLNLPLPTSAKYIGGHHLGNPEPLTKELQAIFHNAKNGVIYVNLGASINKVIAEETLDQMLKLFSQLEQDIIWKYSDKLEHVPSNVHLVSWVPQQTILKHPNTTFMISHGGHLSYLEAMYYGVPLVGIPVAGDQQLTIDIAVSRRRAIKVEYSENFIYNLKEAVDRMLRDHTYTVFCSEASSILHRSLVPPAQELSYWVDLVMETRGAKHLRSPALSLGMMERYNLDVILLLFGLLFMIYWSYMKVVKLVMVYWNNSAPATRDKSD